MCASDFVTLLCVAVDSTIAYYSSSLRDTMFYVLMIIEIKTRGHGCNRQ